jgi:TolA-binding protein
MAGQWAKGIKFHQQKRYNEAEFEFRQLLRTHEKLGQDHQHTIETQYWLGCNLYRQEKYSNAEELFRLAVRRGTRDNTEITHEDNEFWLGITLHMQQKYTEAVQLLQQALHGFKTRFGENDRRTLMSKYWLGKTLFMKKEYGRAKDLLEQTSMGSEKELGEDHDFTIESKYYLGRTLYMQGKDSEATELLLQVLHWRTTNLGEDSIETHKIERLLQEWGSQSLSTNIPIKQASTNRLNAFFPDGEDARELYSDSDIREIAALLEASNPRWSKLPRTYIVLRTIRYLDSLDDLIDAGFTDYWLPVTYQKLPDCLRPSIRAAFVDAQDLVLTKSIHLEKSHEGYHCHFKPGESPPFKSERILGSGGYGQVDKVLSQISFREYARKRVLRSTAFRGRRKEDMRLFIAEIEILKRLKHLHIVEYVGSYTDAKYIGLIMAPVAEMDLAAYLERAGTSKYAELRTFFGCLAAGLDFLHQQKVRHKDIKPGNILVDRGRVLFADFGLSLDFTDASNSTTVSMVNGLSKRYCAPEVALMEPRNTMSDIWSLGVVFMEMIVVLKSKPTEYMDRFFTKRGATQAFIRTNPTVLPDLISQLKGLGKFSDNIALS